LFGATKPLNAAFEIAPDNMPKVIFCKLIALMFRPCGKAQVQVDKNDMFAAAGKRIQGRADSASQPRDPLVGKYRKRSK